MTDEDSAAVVDSGEHSLAPASTTLGRLQRGRGEGWLELLRLEHGQAQEMLWECIVFDPRFDRQVESRAGYYADLAQLIGFDPRALLPECCPPQARWTFPLFMDVLGELDARLIPFAADVLLAHVERGDRWDDAIAELSTASPATLSCLPHALIERFDGHQLTDISMRWDAELPWDIWAESHPEIRNAIAQRSSAQKAHEFVVPPSMHASAAVLLGFAWQGKIPRRLVHRLTQMSRPGERELIIRACWQTSGSVRIPFDILGRLDDPGGIAAAAMILERNQPGAQLGAAHRYISTLSAVHTLDIARRWIELSDSRSSAAGMVFAQHAEVIDIPMMRHRLDQTWNERDYYGMCHMIEALARFVEQGPFEELPAMFEEVEYSYARGVLARTLADTDPSFGRTLARSALWDCESETRSIAASAVDSKNDAEVRDRVAQILLEASSEIAR